MEEIVEEEEFILQADIEAAEKSRIPWNMLEHNRISGLLPFRYYYRDDKVCFQYVTGRLQPVAEYFQGKKGEFDTLFFLCSEVMEIVERGEEYLLKPEEYVIAPERIYWNRLERKVCLCYLPGSGGNLKKGYTTLVEYLLQHTEHKDEQAVTFIYGLYDRLASDCFSVEGLNHYFSSYRETPPKREKGTVSGESAPKSKYYLVYCGDLWKNMSFWTEGIGEYPVPEQREVSVGRDREGDVVIPCPEISRKQAILFRKNQQLYIMDKNSTNGTYLNGKLISGEEKAPCREGDCIRFASHSFKLVCRAQNQ